MFVEGRANVDGVYNAVKRAASLLLKRIRDELSDRHIRVMIQRRLKRTLIPDTDPGKEPIEESGPIQLEFEAMEQFKGIPHSVSVELGPGLVDYVPYSKTSEAQRQSASRILHTQVNADIRKRDALDAGNRFLSSLVAIYGDLEPIELVRHWREDQAGGKTLSADG
jgi:hypothetical protein